MTDTASAKWERFHTAGIKAAEEGRPERAEGAFRLAISAVESIDAFDPRLAASLSALAKLKLQEKDADGAAALYTRALAIIERACGGSHPQVVEGLSVLAAAHIARGDLDMAEPLLRRALSVGEIVWGFEAQDLTAPLNALARLYHKRGEHRKAEPYLTRLLEIKRTLGASHPEVAAVLASLATCHSALGQNTAAERVWREALAIREAQPAADDALLAPALEGLAEACIAQKKYADAVPLLERASAIRERTFGVEHALTTAVHGKLEEARAAVAAAVAAPPPRPSPSAKAPSRAAASASKPRTPPPPPAARRRDPAPRLPFVPAATPPSPAVPVAAAPKAPKAPTPHAAPQTIVPAAVAPEPVVPTPAAPLPVVPTPAAVTPVDPTPVVASEPAVAPAPIEPPLVVVPTAILPPMSDTPVDAAPAVAALPVVEPAPEREPEAKPESSVWAAETPPFLASPMTMPAPIAPAVPTPAAPVMPPIEPPTAPAGEARGMDNAEVIRRHSQNAWLVETEAPEHLETTGALDFKPAAPTPPAPAAPSRRSTQFYMPDMPTQRPAPLAASPAAPPVAPLPDLLSGPMPAALPPEPRRSGGVQRASLLADPIEPPQSAPMPAPLPAPMPIPPEPRRSAGVQLTSLAPERPKPAPPRRAPEPPSSRSSVAAEPPRRRSGPDIHAPLRESGERPRYRRSSVLLGVLTTLVLLAGATGGGLVATGHVVLPPSWSLDSLVAPRTPVDTTPARPPLRERPKITVPIARGAETDPDKIVLVEHGASYAGDKPRLEVQTADGAIAGGAVVDSATLLAAPQLPTQRADLALARVGRAIDDSARARSDSAARAALKLPTFKPQN